MRVKQIARPVYNKLRNDLALSNPIPKAIFLSNDNYKKLCKELGHKVKVSCGVKIANYYLN